MPRGSDCRMHSAIQKQSRGTDASNGAITTTFVDKNASLRHSTLIKSSCLLRICEVTRTHIQYNCTFTVYLKIYYYMSGLIERLSVENIARWKLPSILAEISTHFI